MSESKDGAGKNDVQRRRIGYEKPRLILLGEVQKAGGVVDCGPGLWPGPFQSGNCLDGSYADPQICFVGILGV